VYFCVFQRVWSNGFHVSWVRWNEVFRWRLTWSFARTLHHLYSFQKRFYAMWSFGFAGYDNQSCFHYCVPCSRWQPKTRIIDNNGRALVQPCSLCRGVVSKTPTFRVTTSVVTSDNIVNMRRILSVLPTSLVMENKGVFIFHFIEYCSVLRLCCSVLLPKLIPTSNHFVYFLLLSVYPFSFQ